MFIPSDISSLPFGLSFVDRRSTRPTFDSSPRSKARVMKMCNIIEPSFVIYTINVTSGLNSPIKTMSPLDDRSTIHCSVDPISVSFPTGRRLSSYRFLECLQHACIPVITTENDESLLLPFSERIDWSTAVIDYSNRSLSLLPSYLRQISGERRQAMQEQCAKIWLEYFSSISRIVFTVLDIVHDRFILSSSPL